MIGVRGPEMVLDAGAEVGESPRWDPSGRLLWVDMPVGEVHRWDPATGVDECTRTGSTAGFVVPRASGGVVAGVGTSLVALDLDGADAVTITTLADEDGNRFNDGDCDPAGRLVAGTMGIDARAGAGTLYRFDPAADVAPAVLARGTTVSNGLGWSPDGTRLYYVDSRTNRVDVLTYDPATGNGSDRRPFVDLAHLGGFPDGLCVDHDGAVWVAIWEGWRVVRLTPDGRLDGEIRLPVAQVAACGFGGADGRTLFITTASRITPAARAEQPHAGALFAVDLLIGGPPSTPYRG